MQNSRIITELVISADTRGVDQFKTALTGAGTAVDTATTRIATSTRAITAQETALIRQSAAVGGSAGAIVQLTRASIDLDRAQSAVTRQMQLGTVSMTVGSAELQKLAARQREVITLTDNLRAGTISAAEAFKATAANSNAATASTGQLRFALSSLGSQIGDIGASLASGASPMRILLQQGDQVRMAFAAGGGVNATLAAAGTAIRGMITPTTAAVAGVGALAGGFGLLLTRATSNNEQLRQFNITLDVTGRNAQGMAANLQAAARQLQSLGVSRDAAISAQQSIARNLALNPSQAGRISVTGANVGAALGIGPEAGVERFTAAASGGIDVLARLALQVNAVSASEAALAVQMDASGRGLLARNNLIGAIEVKLRGLAENAMTPMARAMAAMGTAWRDMLDRFADTEGFQTAQGALVGFLNNVAKAAQGDASGLRSTIGNAPILSPSEARGVETALKWVPDPRAIVTGAARVVWQALPDLGNPAANRLEMTEALASRGSEGMADYRRILQQERFGGIPEGTAKATALSGALGGEALAKASGFGVGALPKGTGVSADLARGDIALLDPMVEVQATAARGRYVEVTKQLVATEKEVGVEQRKLSAYWTEHNSVLETTKDATLAHAAGQEAAKRATQLYGVEMQKQTTQTALATQGERAVAEALKESEGAALRVAAAYQARSDVMQGRALNEAARTEEILAANAARTAVELQRGVNENERRVEVIQLETQLQGQLPEIVQQQITLLTAKHDLQRRGVDASSVEGQNYLKSADAIALATRNQAEFSREAERTNNLFRSIGETISSTIGDAISGIFDRKKVQDWGATLKSMLSSVSSQIVQSLLVRPLTGEILGALGASASVVNQFGSLGGGITTGTAGATSSGGISTGTLLQGGGLLKDLFGIKLGGEGGIFGNLFGGSGSGGLGFLDQIGQTLGFATPLQGPTTVAGQTLGAGSLFGSTSFGSFLGGAGLGFGAGSLLNNLLGGDPLIGTVGSGIGSLAGAAIGSILLPGVGTFLGGLLGGSGGGIFSSPLGNRKSLRCSAGATIAI